MTSGTSGISGSGISGTQMSFRKGYKLELCTARRPGPARYWPGRAWKFLLVYGQGRVGLRRAVTGRAETTSGPARPGHEISARAELYYKHSSTILTLFIR